MNTPLPLDAAALDRWSALLARIIDHSDGTRPFAEVYDDELEPFIAQSRAALTLAARVAELEGANNALRDDNEHFRKQAWDRVLEANALRDALEKWREWETAAGTLDADGMLELEADAHVATTRALAAHPAASLAAYRKSVLEEAATECVVAVHAPDDMQHDPLRLETFDDAVGACAAAIRALAAQAQEVKP